METLKELERIVNRREWDAYLDLFSESACIDWFGVLLSPPEAVVISSGQQNDAIRYVFRVKRTIELSCGARILKGILEADYTGGRTFETSFEILTEHDLIYSMTFWRTPKPLSGIVQWVEAPKDNNEFYKIDILEESISRRNRIRIWIHQTFIERLDKIPKPKDKVYIPYWTVYGGEGRGTYNIIEALAGLEIL